ncbi:MAG TPA: hypothetical protein VHN99_10345 [Deinococcales bacterium]|nr:hypothetical protein [Deinococcales bacterium]
MNRPQFRIVSSAEQDLFQERLNRLIESLPDTATLGEVQFSTTVTPAGVVVFSALVNFVVTEPWNED